jgi:hypothetical protein
MEKGKRTPVGEIKRSHLVRSGEGSVLASLLIFLPSLLHPFMQSPVNLTVPLS